jgi:hypothetical protein
MWDVVKTDATTKSSLFLLDAEDQLATMKLSENEDAKAHLAEMKQHFQLMVQRRENLIKMGSDVSDTRFNTIVMASLPESYRPTLQMITAAERANILTGGSQNKLKADDLIAFLMEEAQHRVINTERSKNSEQALATHGKKRGKGKSKAKSDDKALSAESWLALLLTIPRPWSTSHCAQYREFYYNDIVIVCKWIVNNCKWIVSGF